MQINTVILTINLNIKLIDSDKQRTSSDIYYNTIVFFSVYDLLTRISTLILTRLIKKSSIEFCPHNTTLREFGFPICTININYK